MEDHVLSRPRATAKLAVWLAMMAVWLGALLFGAWWMWPRLVPIRLTGEAVAGVVWLLLGSVAWVVALRLGLERFGRRGARR